MKCFHIGLYEKVRDSYITPNSPFSDDQNSHIPCCTSFSVCVSLVGQNMSTARFLFNTYPFINFHSHPSYTLKCLEFNRVYCHFLFVRCPHMLSPTEKIQQRNPFIKTQKVPGHRLCKSALFSEAESIKTAD